MNNYMKYVLVMRCCPSALPQHHDVKISTTFLMMMTGGLGVRDAVLYHVS